MCVDGRVRPPQSKTIFDPVFEVGVVILSGCDQTWVCLSKVYVCVIINSSENIGGGCGHEWVWLPEVGDLLLSRSKDT